MLGCPRFALVSFDLYTETKIELAEPECNTFCMTSANFGSWQLRLNLAIGIHILHFT